MMAQPDLTSKDPGAQTFKDGARELLKLVFQYYLPMGESVAQSWRTDPETFIE